MAQTGWEVVILLVHRTALFRLLTASKPLTRRT